MMAATTHFKLGLLVLVLLAALGATMLFLGVRTQPTQTFHAYFDESVHGLEAGALVKYQGVRVGRVDKIRIAPDRHHVAVALAIDRDKAEELDLAGNPAHFRASLVLVGITGIKLVDIVRVDPWVDPPRPLPFPPRIPYLPTRPSLLTTLERSLGSSSTRLPLVFERLIEAFSQIARVLEDVNSQELARRLAGVLDNASAATANFKDTMQSLDRADLPAKLSDTITSLDRAIAKLDRAAARAGNAVDQVTSKDGVLPSVRRAADSLGDLGRDTSESIRDLDETLRDLSDAARTVRDFFDRLERQPDMLLKGRRGR